MKKEKSLLGITALFGHMIFCLYYSALCLFNCFTPFNQFTFQIKIYKAFYPSETMMFWIYLPIILFGLVFTVLLMIRNKKKPFLISLCFTIILSVFLFLIFGNGYYLKTLPYTAIYWCSSIWFLIDILLCFLYRKEIVFKDNRDCGQ